MQKAVLLSNLCKAEDEIDKEFVSSLASSSGKSKAEIVAKSAWKFFELTANLPLFKSNSKSSLSGNDLHNSDIFLAETVISPSSTTFLTSVSVLICISRSVAVISTFPPLATILKLARIGIVCLLSAIDAPICKTSTISFFSVVNFISKLLKP